MELYERDRLRSVGMSLVPRLRFEHVNLTPFAKMRVDLAAQVSTKLQYVMILLMVNLLVVGTQ